VGTNGVLNSFTDNVSEPNQNFDASLLVGYDTSSGSRLFSGVIDEVAVFSHALTAAQIQQLYSNALTAPPPPTPFQTWQLQYFGCTNCAQAAGDADFDGTGQNNLFKYMAGLDPTNPASVLAVDIANVAGQAGATQLSFHPIATGRVYTIQSCTNLSAGIWSALTSYSGPITNGSQVTITDLNAAMTEEFYRLMVTMP
jgi:hypothetical protein